MSERTLLSPPPYRRHQLLGALGVAAAAFVFSLVQGDALTLGIMSQWATYALAGIGFYIVFGLSGQFAFSQAAFMGLGAYTTAWASDRVGFVVDSVEGQRIDKLRVTFRPWEREHRPEGGDDDGLEVE